MTREAASRRPITALGSRYGRRTCRRGQCPDLWKVPARRVASRTRVSHRPDGGTIHNCDLFINRYGEALHNGQKLSQDATAQGIPRPYGNGQTRAMPRRMLRS